MLDSIPAETFVEVAQGIIGDSVFSVPESTTWESVGAIHADLRTVAVVRYSSTAETQNGTRRWSSVVKVVDADLDPGRHARSDRPESEIQIYQNGYLNHNTIPFRPAKCYKIGNPLDNVKMIWLEDLTSAVQPPWELDDYLKVANHLGSFNGYFAMNPPDLEFEVPVDNYLVKRDINGLHSGVAQLMDYRESDEVQCAYAEVPIEAAQDFVEAFVRLRENVGEFKHYIAFGDSHARNIFPLEHETVGIDWANVSFEPIGYDVGLLIGSALTQHLEDSEMVAANERLIFDSYVEGFRSGGWHGNVDEIRLATLVLIGSYLSSMTILPGDLASGDLKERRSGYEARHGVPFEQIPEKIKPVIAMLPGVIDEIDELLA